MPLKKMINEDHDLLIELRTEMQNVRKDIKELNDGTASRIKSLEINKVDKKNFEDFEILQKKIHEDLEARIRNLEAAKSFYTTSMIIYTAVGTSMIALILYHLLS